MAARHMSLELYGNQPVNWLPSPRGTFGNKTGGVTAGPLTALANRLLGRTGDATGAPAAEAGAASPQTARRPADESEGDEFDD